MMVMSLKTLTNSLQVFDIQRTCVHDGPGIRTTIFFQGCNLRCLWCQNPEGLAFRGQATSQNNYSIEDIMDVVLRDKKYYFSSNGGVTLSGGEPFLQEPENLLSLLKMLKQENIKVAVESSFHAPWEVINEAAPYIDLFLVDLKLVGDEELHVQYTKREPTLIHENIRKLLDLEAEVKFRMVMIPGYTDGEDNISATSEFLKSMGYNSIELLKYHNLYEDKAERLGLEYEPLNITMEKSQASLEEGIKLFPKYGIKAESTYLDSPPSPAEFTERVKEIHKTIKNTKPAVCIEDARLRTEYYKNYGFKKPYKEGEFAKPGSIHRAECLAYVLKNKETKIYPRELLVGNFTSSRVGGRTWPEYISAGSAMQLIKANNRKPVAFQSSLKDNFTFLTEVAPYWIHHSQVSKLWPDLAQLGLLAARTTEWNIGMNFNILAIGHYIVNFERILSLGTSGMIEEIEEKKKEMPESTHNFYNGAIIALEGLEQFGQKYAEHLWALCTEESDSQRRQELEELAEICEHVPRYPARTFHEALQSMLFLQIALCLESYENAISFGRLDQILYPYYKEDIQEERITYEKAKELLSLFILKMDELVLVNNGDNFPEMFRLFETISTDQAYTFGGVDQNGADATNDITYMLIDICELQPRAADPAARIHEDSPNEYLERLAEVYLSGCPLPQVFSDKVYIDSLLKHYPTTLEDARNYSIVGCVEPLASDDHFGNTDCANMNLAMPFLQALKGQTHDLWNFERTDSRIKLATNFAHHISRERASINRLVNRGSTKLRERRNLQKGVYNYQPPSSMEDLVERFQKRLNQLAKSILADHKKMEESHRENFPTPLSSSLYRGCIESGKDILEGGTTINSSGIQAIAVTDVADSLHAIEEVVFKNNLYSINDVIKAIDDNFEGEENQEIREALLKVPKFGDDHSSRATQWVNKVMEIYNNALDSAGSDPRNGRYSAGYYALNLANMFGQNTPALPSGRLEGVPFANSITPHYGKEQSDLLSALNSIAGIDFAEHAENGTTATLTIDSSLFPGEEGKKNLVSIFKTFLTSGGMQLQPNVVNREMLLDAYENPEKYPDLLVRIAGYCEYFNNLSDDMKWHVINRTQYS